MKKNIIYIILFILVLLNIVVIFNNYINKNNNYMILDKNNIWKLDKKVKKVSKYNIKRLNYENATMYNEGSVKGYFDSEKFFFYDENLEKYSDIYNSIIVIGNTMTKNYTNLISDVNEIDLGIIAKFLKENSLKFDENSIYAKKAILPNNITIYSVQTLNNSEIDQEYSVVFIVENNKTNLVYKKVNSKDEIYSSLNKIIDITGDGNAEIILYSDQTNNSGKECYSLYEYNSTKKTYIPIINCEKGE